MVVLRGIIGVATPPAVSIARVRGVTSSRRTSLTSPLSTPPWMAAPIGHDFVRVHALVRFLADELARGLDDLRHASHATDEHELINILLGELGVSRGNP